MSVVEDTLKELKKEVLDHIANGNNDDAFHLLKQFLEHRNANSYSELLNLSNQYFKLKRESILGLGKKRKKIAKITHRLIFFTIQLEEEEESNLKPPENNPSNKISVWVLSLIFLVLFAYYGIKNTNGFINNPMLTETINNNASLFNVKNNVLKKHKPIQFNIRNKLNTLLLIFESELLNISDTFEIDREKKVSELKHALLKYYDIENIIKINNSNNENNDIIWSIEFEFTNSPNDSLSLNFCDIKNYDRVRLWHRYISNPKMVMFESGKNVFISDAYGRIANLNFLSNGYRPIFTNIYTDGMPDNLSSSNYEFLIRLNLDEHNWSSTYIDRIDMTIYSKNDQYPINDNPFRNKYGLNPAEIFIKVNRKKRRQEAGMLN